MPTWLSRWPQKLCWKAQVALREEDLWEPLRELPRLPLFPLWKPQQILPHQQLILPHPQFVLGDAQHPFATAQAQMCGADAPAQVFSPKAGVAVRRSLFLPREGWGAAPLSTLQSPWGPWFSPPLMSYQATPRQYGAHWTPTYTPRNYTPEMFMSRKVFPRWQCHQNHLGDIVWSVHQPAQRAASTVLLFCHSVDPAHCWTLKAQP